ncbi:RrF2 family transcriptional regulator [Allofournierella sp.]|uniref:RrF2 family transcriptional regulator n=1 Tax=Allofournierella sp. TaxID=1940256 RepID=UPI003AB6F5F3
MNSDFNVAVHALVYMEHKAVTLSSDELAENICTNPARVRKVLAKLKKAGFLVTKEGADGGYQLTKSGDEITLRQVGEAMELCFVSTGWKSGDREKPCLVASGMAGVMDGIYTDLNERCKERLGEITIGGIVQHIFGAAPGSAQAGG